VEQKGATVADEIICPRCSAPNPQGTGFCGKCGTSLEGEQQEEETDTLLGSFVGERFLVQQKLGEGGMGVVYLAEQTAIGRKVALKVLHPALTDENLYARFRNEAAASSRLHHQNTITIYDFGKTETGSLYIAMEFVQGISLDDEIAEHGALDWQRTCRIAAQICGSLQEAHDAGIIHRDLKPENVMLCERAGETDVVKVLDFGIAKIAEDDGQDQRKALTKTGMVFGTPQYMSPEQIRGEKVDARSDIYSTGVIIYQMLAGVLPFKSETPMGVLTKHLMDTPPPLAESAPAVDVPIELEQVVLETLAKDRDDRLSTMKEFAAQIDGVLNSAGPLAGPRPTEVTASAVPGGADSSAASPAAAPVPRTEVAVEPLAPVASSADTPPKKGKGGLIAMIIIAAVVLFGGGGTLAWYFLLGPGSFREPQIPQGGYQMGGVTPPIMPPDTGQQLQPQPQPQPVGVGTQPVPENLPAIPIDTGGEKTSGGSSGSTGGGKKPKPKPKDKKCAVFTKETDAVGKQIATSLRGREGKIRSCTKPAGATVTVRFSVAAGSSSLKGVKAGGAASPAATSCIKGLVAATKIGKPDSKSRMGTVVVSVERKGGAVNKCNVGVSSRKPSREPKSPGLTKSKSKGKSGLTVKKHQ
jgi:serine/threonine-protein kinase